MAGLISISINLVRLNGLKIVENVIKMTALYFQKITKIAKLLRALLPRDCVTKKVMKTLVPSPLSQDT